METVYAYIAIVEEESSGKTKRYTVKNLKSGKNIGAIQWYAPWRQFCFFPIEGTVFSSGCMKDIVHFIGKAMDEHAAKVYEEKQGKAQA